MQKQKLVECSCGYFNNITYYEGDSYNIQCRQCGEILEGFLNNDDENGGD